MYWVWVKWPQIIICLNCDLLSCQFYYRYCICRVVHLDVEDCSEELIRQQSYAIKNQLGHPKPPTAPRWFFMA